MTDLDLFGPGLPDPAAPAEGSRSAHSAPSSADGVEAPLAARMRPRGLDEFEGQEHLLGEGKVLRALLERGEVGSMILWGPPGSGKTTLARLVAELVNATFVPFSAVMEGVPRVRAIIAEARERNRAVGRRTILFCDEIHRFNKAQQDAFLPHVEDGTVILIGATTQNPSFEIIRPLLSRAPVLVLEPLTSEAIVRILGRAIADPVRGYGARLECTREAMEFIAVAADGDARRALGVLETAAGLVGGGGTVDEPLAREALQHRYAVYDKGGEQHYDLISALHKSVRGSDPQAALYWLARMIEGGEDPLYIARRLVRMASEDVGLADPEALGIATAAREAYSFLGTPEGELALAEATVYLATSPKSNRVYAAWKAARDAARETGSAPVPLHVRNAPTELMRDLGYGAGYRYNPDDPSGALDQTYLPVSLSDARFYEPGDAGFEREIRSRLDAWAELRRSGRGRGGADRATTDESREETDVPRRGSPT